MPSTTTINNYVLPQYTDSNYELLNKRRISAVYTFDDIWEDTLSDDIPENRHSSLNEDTLEKLRELHDEGNSNQIQHNNLYPQHTKSSNTKYNKNNNTTNNKKQKLPNSRLTSGNRISSPVTRSRSVPLHGHSLNKSMSMKDISRILDKRQEKRKVEIELLNQKLSATSKKINAVY
jgi:hypothetical protein